MMEQWGKTALRKGPDSSGCKYICEWYVEYGKMDGKLVSVFHTRNIEMGEKDFSHYTYVCSDYDDFVRSVTNDREKGILSERDYQTCLLNAKSFRK